MERRASMCGAWVKRVGGILWFFFDLLNDSAVALEVGKALFKFLDGGGLSAVFSYPFFVSIRREVASQFWFLMLS